MLIQCESPNNLLILSVCSVCTNRNGELDYREDRSLESKRFETNSMKLKVDQKLNVATDISRPTCRSIASGAKLGFSFKSFFLDNQAYIE